MLYITVAAMEYFDEVNEQFINVKEQRLALEHSLVSMSKWEAIWNKPLLGSEDRTHAEAISYIQCMTITQNVDPLLYSGLSTEQLQEVADYISAPMTATVFSEGKGGGPMGREIITSELIYYYMTSLNIPFECQKWHINRLLTLIRVCSIKNAPPEKMSRAETISRNRELNAQRRKELNTKG